MYRQMVLDHLKTKNLFDPKDYAYVVPDDKLRHLMGEDRARYKVKKLARQTRNPKPETRNPKPETINHKP